MLGVADEVQNNVLPNLFHLLVFNEGRLPVSIQYYFYAAVSIIFLTVIWPIVHKLFFDDQLYLNIGIIVLLGLFIHILLMLRAFLKLEATLKLPDDYR